MSVMVMISSSRRSAAWSCVIVPWMRSRSAWSMWRCCASVWPESSAFAPVLGHNGGGAVLNVLSALSWFGYPGSGSYHLAKAAAWAMTNSARLELADQGTLVTGVHLGLADTGMSARFVDTPKLAPSEVVRAALDGVEAGDWEVLVDDWSRTVKTAFAGDPRKFYAALAAMTF